MPLQMMGRKKKKTRSTVDCKRYLEHIQKKIIDVTVVMWDFNAKIGGDNTGYQEIMGIHALGTLNENRERFADLCALNSLVIGGSLFPNKRIHKNS